MGEIMKDFFAGCGAFIFIFYTIGSLVAFVGGLSSSTSNFEKDHQWGCYGPTRRIHYVVPAYRVGCWLGQPTQEKQ